MDFDAKAISQVIGLVCLAATAAVYVLNRAHRQAGQKRADDANGDVSQETTYIPDYQIEEVLIPAGSAGSTVAPLDPQRPVLISMNPRTGEINWVH